MSRICEVTWKKTLAWQKRSHSMRATKRKFYPNLFYRNIKDPATGLTVRIRVSAAGIRTLKKKGIL